MQLMMLCPLIFVCKIQMAVGVRIKIAFSCIHAFVLSFSLLLTILISLSSGKLFFRVLKSLSKFEQEGCFVISYRCRYLRLKSIRPCWKKYSNQGNAYHPFCLYKKFEYASFLASNKNYTFS